MSKKNKIVLIVLSILSMIFVFPCVIRAQWIKGIAVSEQGQVAVVTCTPLIGTFSPFVGTYINIYSQTNSLERAVQISLEGEEQSAATENDMICIYYHGYKCYYSFDGTYLYLYHLQQDDTDIPSGTGEYKNGDTIYEYSINSVGWETVKKHTSNGRSKLLHGGIGLYFAKVQYGIFICLTVDFVAFVCICYPFGYKLNVLFEDIKKYLKL